MEKRYILDEIRRTAALNGGKPLGRLRLENECGINEHHWHKHWARYNDAVREAGFAPNSITTPYDEAALIAHLVLLTRLLGRFPAQADITVAASSNRAVPSLKTFVTRLGNKPQMIEKVVDYCRRTPGNDDVLSQCEVASVPQHVVEHSDPTADTTNDGFVYLIRLGKYYKLGRTNHVGRRERELSIQLPQQPNTIHSIRTDDPIGIEAYWHKRFAEQRLNGEWFNLSPQDVSAFRRRKFM